MKSISQASYSTSKLGQNTNDRFTPADNQGVPGEDDGPQAGPHCGHFFHVRNVRVPVGRRLLDLQVRRQRVHGRRYRATSAAGLQRQNPDDLRVPVLHCYAKGHCRVPQKAAVSAESCGVR